MSALLFQPARRAALAGALAVLAATTVAAPATVSAATTRCVVRNTTTGDTRQNLSAAIRRASAGQELTLKGTCPGGVVVRKNITVRGIQPAGYGKPILDGQGNVRHVLWIKPGVTATVRGITIKGGAATGTSDPGNAGGGILNQGTLTLRQAIVRDSSAATRGGGIRSTGTLALNNTQVRNNAVTATDASGEGCGISASGAVTLRGTSSVHHNAPTGDGCAGGGIHLENTASLVMLDTSSIHNNTSGGLGGAGIVAYGAAVTLNESARIHHNSTFPGGAGGGAYLTGGAVLTMRGSSSIDNNSAVEGGGVDNYATVHMKGSSSIHHNSASTQGGGILAVGTVLMEGSATVHHNTATTGAGIKVSGGITMASTNLVNDNTASSEGGGVWIACESSATGVNAGTNVKDNTPDNVFTPACSS